MSLYRTRLYVQGQTVLYTYPDAPFFYTSTRSISSYIVTPAELDQETGEKYITGWAKCHSSEVSAE